jgi:RNA polymerase sigma factor (sigma-70 family)
VDDSLEAWFAREILTHEAALMRYLGSRRNGSLEPADLRNEIYVRVLESAERALPAQPRAFLFTTARNLLIDQARRNRVVAIDLLEDIETLNVLIDPTSPERHVSGRQQLQRLSRLLYRMPARCREVFWLRRVDGLSQKEVAHRLRISEGAVEKYVYRAMRFLTDALYGKPILHEEGERDGLPRQATVGEDHEHPGR